MSASAMGVKGALDAEMHATQDGHPLTHDPKSSIRTYAA